MSFNYRSALGTSSVVCNLTCKQCKADTKAGNRCGRMTCKQLPFCGQHSKSELGVQIKKSTIRGAGDGLFALKRFKKGDRIAPYTGERINAATKHARYGRSKNDVGPYVAQMSKNDFIDAACTRGTGGYANSKPGDNNAKLATNLRKHTVSVKATKNIPVGQEVFVAYGSNYFKRPNPLPKPVFGTTTRKLKVVTPPPPPPPAPKKKVAKKPPPPPRPAPTPKKKATKRPSAYEDGGALDPKVLLERMRADMAKKKSKR